MPDHPHRLDLTRERRIHGFALPGATTSAFDTAYPRRSDSASVGSYHKLCRRPPVEVESVLAPKPALVRRVGKEACEGCSFGLRRYNEDDDIALSAHRGPLRELRL